MERAGDLAPVTATQAVVDYGAEERTPVEHGAVERAGIRLRRPRRSGELLEPHRGLALERHRSGKSE